MAQLFNFDFYRAAAALVWLITVSMASVVPLVSGLRRADLLDKLMGILLSCTGAIYCLRTERAITITSEHLSAEMPPDLFSALTTAALITCWTSAWMVVVPELLIRFARSPLRGFGWGLAAVGTLWATLAVLGPLPGLLARATVSSVVEGHAKDAQHAAQNDVARRVNSLTACTRLVEIAEKLTPTDPTQPVPQAQSATVERINRLIEKWGVGNSLGIKLQDCTPKLIRPLWELKKFVQAIEAEFRQYSRARLKPMVWKDDAVTAEVMQVGLKSADLGGYFRRAFTEPASHVVAVVTETDLPSSLLLLFELALVLMTTLQAALRRNSVTDRSRAN